MKIRTDFVTNSSSYSSASIVIDNPVLMDILIKYKEIGLFEDLGLDFEIASDSERTFAYYKDDDLGCLSSLQECLEGIIQIMVDIQYDNDENENEYDKDLFETMVKELRENEEKILEAYNRVSWLNSENTNWEDYNGWVLIDERFNYDREKGEEVYYCQEGQDTGEIIRKEHRINGKDVDIDEDSEG